jgi:hypothetical protein
VKNGDVVHITGIGECKIRDPLYALVIDDNKSQLTGPLMVMLTGGYLVSDSWCLPGHRFHLPHKPRNCGSAWQVVTGSEIPAEIAVEIAKRALLG